MTQSTPLKTMAYQERPEKNTSASVSQAFWRAARSQLHPSMIFALFLPVIVTIVLFSILLWFGFAPLNEWLIAQFDQSVISTYADPWVGVAGLLWFKSWLIPFISLFMLLPLAGIAGLAVAAVWIMPWVLSHLSTRNYPDVQARGRHATLLSVWNAIWVSLVFLLGWLITLPLWLIPPLGLILSVFWWTFAFTKMMRIDSLVDHASPAELKAILHERSRSFWIIGLICALANLFPPAWIFLPVFSGLVFAHYSFQAIRDLRQ
jgi:hypothetical protein